MFGQLADAIRILLQNAFTDQFAYCLFYQQ